MSRLILSTGQRFCADRQGGSIDCPDSGQDAEFAPGLAWTASRFAPSDETVLDALTGLTWLRNANALGFPISWQEAQDYIRTMNSDKIAGHDDWRLPNKRELFSLISFDTHSPALPEDHPFENVFHGWYWTSTLSAMHPEQIWHVHFMGGRMFWGTRTGYELVWPVRGTSDVIPAITSGSDDFGVEWPKPRFETDGDVVIDRLTGLRWTRSADLADGPVDWETAFSTIAELNDRETKNLSWRLPTIRELESLADTSTHSPALPEGHPFTDTREAYWSSTNSGYEADWAMCFYLHKGAAGVGYKADSGFHVWAVADQP